MKAFIDKVFKAKKLKEEVEIKVDEAPYKVEPIKKEQVINYPKPKHFPDCNCFKCGRWKQQNAK